MGQLWQKKGSKFDKNVNAFIISRTLAEDTVLVPYDVRASLAHAHMLAKVGLLKASEVKALEKGLNEALCLYEKGEFVLKQEDEDCHTAIENFLISKVGEVGKRIHMGRSRNDQVLVAMRLYQRAQLKEVMMLVIQCADTAFAFAKKYEFVPMPGYTHTQQAMPSSVGQWAGALVESLLDDMRALLAAYEINNQNPLGSAAGFGTSLPIDRLATTKELGFSRTQVNSLYCQNSRGKIEAFLLSSLYQVMMTLGRLANDLVWFTSSELRFFVVESRLTTGSSIMPQKRNLDVMEVLRANVSVMAGLKMQVEMAGHNLISGYNKDLKVTKKAVMEAFSVLNASLIAVTMTLEGVNPDVKRLKEVMQPEIFATDAANALVMKGMPFRDAYREIGARVLYGQKGDLTAFVDEDPVKNIRAKKHLGATGNLGLSLYGKELRKFEMMTKNLL